MGGRFNLCSNFNRMFRCEYHCENCNTTRSFRRFQDAACGPIKGKCVECEQEGEPSLDCKHCRETIGMGKAKTDEAYHIPPYSKGFSKDEYEKLMKEKKDKLKLNELLEKKVEDLEENEKKLLNDLLLEVPEKGPTWS